MKAGVAVGMLATRALRDQIEAGELSGSIVLQAGIGEETAEPGTLSLLAEDYDGEYGVAPSLATVRMTFISTRRTRWSFVVVGKTAASSATYFAVQGWSTVCEIERTLSKALVRSFHAFTPRFGSSTQKDRTPIQQRCPQSKYMDQDRYWHAGSIFNY
jgi:hypothetical protein